MKKILVSLLVICSVVLLAGCGKKNTLLGTWEGKNDSGLLVTMEFKKNNKMHFKSVKNNVATPFESDGKYSMKDNTVTISLDAWDGTELEYTYEVVDNKLSLTPKENGRPIYEEMIKK